MTHARFVLPALLCAAISAHAQAADLTKGTPDLKSAGPLAFGPQGLLFVGDAAGAAIYAIDTNDRATDSAGGSFKVEAINQKLAALLGCEASSVVVNDMAVNPASGKVYLSIARGKGADAAPVIARVERSGKIEVVSMADVPFARANLANAPDAKAAAKRGPSPRSQAITDLAYVDGRVYVAGLSNEKFSSRLVSIPYPFTADEDSTSVEIYHGAHGRFETSSPIRTFAPYKINGEPYLMAAYTCTPLVKIPVAALKPGTHFKGATVAELGNGNQPLDMVIYQKAGKDYILMANSARGLMKITTEGLADAESISTQISTTAGQAYEKVNGPKKVVQLDRLDNDNAVVLSTQDNGDLNLETILLP